MFLNITVSQYPTSLAQSINYHTITTTTYHHNHNHNHNNNQSPHNHNQSPLNYNSYQTSTKVTFRVKHPQINHYLKSTFIIMNLSNNYVYNSNTLILYSHHIILYSYHNIIVHNNLTLILLYIITNDKSMNILLIVYCNKILKCIKRYKSYIHHIVIVVVVYNNNNNIIINKRILSLEIMVLIIKLLLVIIKEKILVITHFPMNTLK